MSDSSKTQPVESDDSHQLHQYVYKSMALQLLAYGLSLILFVVGLVFPKPYYVLAIAAGISFVVSWVHFPRRTYIALERMKART